MSYSLLAMVAFCQLCLFFSLSLKASMNMLNLKLLQLHSKLFTLISKMLGLNDKGLCCSYYFSVFSLHGMSVSSVLNDMYIGC